MRIAAHPELYSPDAAPPKLNGGRCRHCSYIFFPPHRYGCEACGAPPDDLEPFALAGSGVLRSSAVVHQGIGTDNRFTVGAIVLDDGPAIRAVLACRADEALRAGDRMRAVLVPQRRDERGNEIVELRFEKAQDR
jgi:uncharacterized protein